MAAACHCTAHAHFNSHLSLPHDGECQAPSSMPCSPGVHQTAIARKCNRHLTYQVSADDQQKRSKRVRLLVQENKRRQVLVESHVGILYQTCADCQRNQNSGLLHSWSKHAAKIRENTMRLCAISPFYRYGPQRPVPVSKWLQCQGSHDPTVLRPLKAVHIASIADH